MSKLVISSSILIASLFATTSMSAQAAMTANVAIQSDYAWRGISQNSADPSIQGGLDYANSSGFYAGVWGASVNFGGAESTEMDLYLGWQTELKSGLGLDLGLIEYTYHGGTNSSDSNFTEAYMGLSYVGFSLYYYAGDEFDDLIEVGYEYAFDGGIGMFATYGDYDAYSYYTVGASTDIAGIGLELSYRDTDISLADLGGDQSAYGLVNGRVVFTISKEF